MLYVPKRLSLTDNCSVLILEYINILKKQCAKRVNELLTVILDHLVNSKCKKSL